MDYIKLWLPELKAILEPFSDGERGRLVMAMINYAEASADPTFRGNERFAWGALRTTVDRERAFVDKQTVNGNKGGRPPKQTDAENPKKSGFPQKTQKNLGFQEKTQKTHNGTEYNGTEYNGAERNTTGTEYSAAVTEIALAWEKASCQRITDRVREILLDWLDTYSAEQILSAIDKAVKAGKVSLAYTEGILRNAGKRQQQAAASSAMHSNALDEVLAELEEEIR